jgi:very-short-patch-repair endonuclease
MKKMEVLSFLGWSVLRFDNQTIMQNPDYVADCIRWFIALKLNKITTSMPMAS